MWPRPPRPHSGAAVAQAPATARSSCRRSGLPLSGAASKGLTPTTLLEPLQCFLPKSPQALLRAGSPRLVSLRATCGFQEQRPPCHQATPTPTGHQQPSPESCLHHPRLQAGKGASQLGPPADPRRSRPPTFPGSRPGPTSGLKLSGFQV